MDRLATVSASTLERIGRIGDRKLDQVLRGLAGLVTRIHCGALHKPRPYRPGDPVPYGGRIYDEKEMVNLVEASLDHWLTAGRFAEQFERRLAEYLGLGHCLMTNSGSSANLLAFMALTSIRLKERRIKRGDEVITVAACFPTTLAPILQYGAVPVLVDVMLPTYNIDCTLLEPALSKKTRAVMLAHTLGNPFDLDPVIEFCRKNGLWLVEDNCDALGAVYHSSLRYQGSTHSRTGAFGDLSTLSFYPSHHITTGEGGAVCTDDPELERLVLSFRDWGRDCWCKPGRDNTCGRRFSQQFGELPFGYDHKYVYSHFGYNLKATDMQAAIGCAQMDKLPFFLEKRRKNFGALYEGLRDLEDRFILPRATPGAEPSWFGFPLTVREGETFTRNDLVRHLEQGGIQTRMLFSGNVLRHPCFDEWRGDSKAYRIVSRTPEKAGGMPLLPVTDRVMRDTFWIGLYPGMTADMLAFVMDRIHGFFGR
ncbi:MAG: lipopolysaccharide biosynthesis protein RfbH [Deltaproteobacteria bacterium]|nr:lipopolysaccharide biosynthesis protein RfbH [Deltaproteobacteria bacterium]